jgi:hypothetical protein
MQEAPFTAPNGGGSSRQTVGLADRQTTRIKDIIFCFSSRT